MRWQGLRTRGGYGRYFTGGHEYRAHVYAWEYDYFNVPRGGMICHRCDVRDCVNIDHLFLTNHDGDMRDMVLKGRQARGSRHRAPAFSHGMRRRHWRRCFSSGSRHPTYAIGPEWAT